jgi:hypothetical protein
LFLQCLLLRGGAASETRGGAQSKDGGFSAAMGNGTGKFNMEYHEMNGIWMNMVCIIYVNIYIYVRW